MEHTDPRSFNPKLHIQAPASLAANLERRLAVQAEYASPLKSGADLLNALDDQRWEIRSAALQELARRGELSPTKIFAALQDENTYVRMAALHILSSFPAHIAEEPLQAALCDPNWQVREIALLALDKLGRGGSSTIEELAHHDPTSTVRSTAQLVLSHRVSRSAGEQRQQQDTRSVSHMAIEQQNNTDLVQSTPVLFRPKRLHKISLLAAAAIFILLAFTAAGYASYGWWSSLFGGDQSAYQTVSQTVTNHGVTIQLTQAYADEKRTVIVYTISPLGAANLIDLTGNFPQKPEQVSGTSCVPENNLYHCYWVETAFLVPAETSTLTLTWNVGQFLPHPSSSKQPAPINGRWHFVFTIPFHHENNPHLPNPIQGGTLPS